MTNKQKTLQGIAWFLLATLCMESASLILKMLSQGYHPFQVLFVRIPFIFLFFLPIIAKKGLKPLVQTKSIPIHLIRGVINAATMSLTIYGLKYAPLADVSALKFSTPILITIIAVIFLKEKLQLSTIVTLFTGFCGILVIIQPDFKELNFAYILILLAALTSALNQVFVKKLMNKGEHSNTLTFCTFITLIIISSPLALFNWKPISGIQDLSLFALAAFGAMFYTKLQAIAYSKTNMSVLQPFNFTRLIFAAILGFAFFGRAIKLETAIGGAIVFGSCLILGLIKKYKKEKTSSKILPK